jgi:hypothetical protein
MTIEILYIEGCPNLPATVEAVKNALRQVERNCPITETKVGDQGMALHVGFLGSPTIRVDGLDIEPSARLRTTYGMMCRTYEGSGGVPSEQLIRRAIEECANG